jgi:hypothetical protein
VTSRLPTTTEQAFLLKLAYLVIERRGFGLSFELEGPRMRVVAHPLYGAPAHLVVTVDDCRRARSAANRPITVYDVAARLHTRLKGGLG